MKKIVSILLLASTLIFALSACGMGKPKIEDYEWKMRTIAHIEGDSWFTMRRQKKAQLTPKRRLSK